MAGPFALLAGIWVKLLLELYEGVGWSRKIIYPFRLKPLNSPRALPFLLAGAETSCGSAK